MWIISNELHFLHGKFPQNYAGKICSLLLVRPLLVWLFDPLWLLVERAERVPWVCSLTKLVTGPCSPEKGQKETSIDSAWCGFFEFVSESGHFPEWVARMWLGTVCCSCITAEEELCSDVGPCWSWKPKGWSKALAALTAVIGWGCGDLVAWSDSFLSELGLTPEVDLQWMVWCRRRTAERVKLFPHISQE